MKNIYPFRSFPGGGYTSNYEDDSGDAIPIGDTKSAESYYNAKLLAQKLKAAKMASSRNPNAVTTGPQGAAPVGTQQWIPPSGAGGFGIRGGTSTTSPATLQVPAYDEQKVESLAQRVAAPSVRKLRNEVQAVQGGVYDNPNVKALTLRQALGGYGQGLEDVMGGAFGSATSIYNQQYQPQVRAAELTYQANLERELQQKRLDAQYQNAWASWMAKNQG